MRDHLEYTNSVGRSRTACGAVAAGRRTRILAKVTCAQCKCTNVFKAAARGPDEEEVLRAENARLRAELTKARQIVKDYVVAQGPHLYESWRNALIANCGLVVDAIGFVTVPPIGVDQTK